MAEIKLSKTTIKGLKIICLSIPFVVMGIWGITEEPYGTTGYIMGWFGTCFFGLGILIVLFQTFDKRPQIVINENGIWDRTTNQDEIKWEQIIQAYPLDIFDQKFISIVTDKTFVFKKKRHKWAAKINKEIGAQGLNLQLSQIDIDANKLTDLINNLSNSKKEDRKKIIQSFKTNRIRFSGSNIQKILLYVSISIGLLLLSFTSRLAITSIMITMALAALTARWYWFSNENSKIRKYAGIIALLGFVNMFLCLLTIKTYDYGIENVAQKFSTEIKIYNDRYSSYPDNLESLGENIDLNILEQYFSSKIKYSFTETYYELKYVNLFNNVKKIDQELKKNE